jgi:hypothetical protein
VTGVVSAEVYGRGVVNLLHTLKAVAAHGQGQRYCTEWSRTILDGAVAAASLKKPLPLFKSNGEMAVLAVGQALLLCLGIYLAVRTYYLCTSALRYRAERLEAMEGYGSEQVGVNKGSDDALDPAAEPPDFRCAKYGMLTYYCAPMLSEVSKWDCPYGH